jgi:hypothetical protein
MPRFKFAVLRVSYAWATIEMDGDDETDARKKVQEVTGDHTYNEKDAEYSVEECEEIK